MNPVLFIILNAKATPWPNHKIPFQLNTDFGLAIIAFIAFILLTYIVLSQGKPKPPSKRIKIDLKPSGLQTIKTRLLKRGNEI